MSLQHLDHEVLSYLKEREAYLKNQKIHLAFSGGVDSLSLAFSLLKFKKLFKYDLVLLHIYHGKLKNYEKINRYREKAKNFCKDFAAKNKIKIEVIESQRGLLSEAECRDFRLDLFNRKKNLFLAHHKEDFFETLIIRLLRGTGLKGLKEVFNKEGWHYPYLHKISKKEILDYALSEGLSFCEDPTNQDGSNLRAWLRKDWLPLLEKKRGLSGFYGSLENIYKEAKQIDHSRDLIFLDDQKRHYIDHLKWLRMTRDQKESLIAEILHFMKKKGYNRGLIKEVIKILDKEQKRIDFELAGIKWTKDEKSIFFERI